MSSKTLTRFLGINNVAAPERHTKGELATAREVDIDATGALLSRRGHTLLRELDCGHSLHQAPGYLLCVTDGTLVAVTTDGEQLVLSPSLGHTRVWYANLPDGRVAFSNGLISGLTDGATVAPWGVPTPTDAGVTTEGPTPYWLTYVRQSDGLESAPMYCGPAAVGAEIYGLPQRDGYDIDIYYALDGMTGFRAGRTSTDSYQFAGDAADLIAPCLTEHLVPPPPGKLLVVWKARLLLAVGKMLVATSPYQWEQTDARRDYLQVPDEITLIHGTESGIWVGTTRQLLFLTGPTLAELTVTVSVDKPVALGSCVPTDFKLMPEKERPDVAGAFCLLGGNVCALGDNGQFAVYAAQQYHLDATEVVATVRERAGVLQYLASPA